MQVSLFPYKGILSTNVFAKAIVVNKPDVTDALDVLAKVGGFEIAAIAGSILQAAASQIPLVIDGFTSTAGAFIAANLAPKSTAYMIPSHGSVEIGHHIALAGLDLDPILNLNMRLGERTGAVLSFHFIEAVLLILDEMATFADAGVSEKLNKTYAYLQTKNKGSK